MSNLTAICIEHRNGVQQLERMCNELLGSPKDFNRLYPLVFTLLGFLLGFIVSCQIETEQNEKKDRVKKEE
jgi:hypothetical protein